MPFELPKLPYDYAALEPTIDEATMKLLYAIDAGPWQQRTWKAVPATAPRRDAVAVSKGDQNRLGSGFRNLPRRQRPAGPRERERASHALGRGGASAHTQRRRTRATLAGDPGQMLSRVQNS